MTRWEYRSVSISYSKKAKDWAVEYEDDTSLIGWQNILDTYGSNGWELVSLQPTVSEIYPTFGKWNLEHQAYMATFKRPRAE